MKRTFILAATAVTLNACTIEQQNGELRQEYNPPLAYATWKTETYKTQSGKPVCVVTSGYNGLSVQQKRDGKNIALLAGTERKMTPGTEFKVNVGGNHYRTVQGDFSAAESQRLAEDLSGEGKAYLEFTEPHGDDHNRLRSSNILKLDGFKAQFDACRATLLK
jgi:hypothetical protein